jgi:hypothetical protein
MRPGDHPDFFRLAPPPGTSRESSIRLDAEGNFWHEGERVDHPALASALHRWIARHPDDGRYILTNGYDWTYFHVDDAPYTVRAVRIEPSRISLVLSDDTVEPLEPAALFADSHGVLRTMVKGGAFPARFSRHAQTGLAPALAGEGDDIHLDIGGQNWPIRTGADPLASAPGR